LNTTVLQEFVEGMFDLIQPRGHDA
jgi:hypothetical protein